MLRVNVGLSRKLSKDYILPAIPSTWTARSPLLCLIGGGGRPGPPVDLRTSRVINEQNHNETLLTSAVCAARGFLIVIGRPLFGRQSDRLEHELDILGPPGTSRGVSGCGRGFPACYRDNGIPCRLVGAGPEFDNLLSSWGSRMWSPFRVGFCSSGSVIPASRWTPEFMFESSARATGGSSWLCPQRVFVLTLLTRASNSCRCQNDVALPYLVAELVQSRIRARL